MRLRFSVELILLAGLSLFTTFAQPAISGKISGGFQAPAARDNEGRRHVLKGSDAKPLPNKIFEITAPRVTSFRADNTLDMVIEAPICRYDSVSNVASSDSDLSFKTTDGRFSIQGVGWLWDPSQSHLTISNKVVALVLKSALNNPSPGQHPGKTQTNQPVRIISDSFIYDGNLATFIGNVRVNDGDDTLNCGKLMVDFENPQGVQKIEAIENVSLHQGETEVRSGHAIYDTKDNIIQILEKPVWKSGLREGSSDTLLLNRSNNTFFAAGNVYMKLPFTNVVSTNMLAAGTNAPSTNRFLEISADKFRFRNASTNGQPSHAVYENNVRARYEETQLRCVQLDVDFSTNNQVSRVFAQKNVEILSNENKAFGDSATYDISSDKINIIGNPHWELGNSRGSSQTLLLYPKTKEVFAFQNVEMLMPAQAAGNLGLLGARTNSLSRTNSPSTTNKTVVKISSDNFSHQDNISVFHDNVVVTEERGKLECEMITVLSGASNQVQRIVASKNVVISQQDMVARGDEANYDVPQGLLYLTGNPTITSGDRTAEAAAFIINRNQNTFSVAPGKYRIRMQAKRKETAPRKQ